MERSMFSDEQIIWILKEKEAGTVTADVCCRHQPLRQRSSFLFRELIRLHAKPAHQTASHQLKSIALMAEECIIRGILISKKRTVLLADFRLAYVIRSFACVIPLAHCVAELAFFL